MVVRRFCAVDAFLNCMRDQIVTDGHFMISERLIESFENGQQKNYNHYLYRNIYILGPTVLWHIIFKYSNHMPRTRVFEGVNRIKWLWT